MLKLVSYKIHKCSFTYVFIIIIKWFSHVSAYSPLADVHYFGTSYSYFWWDISLSLRNSVDIQLWPSVVMDFTPDPGQTISDFFLPESIWSKGNYVH